MSLLNPGGLRASHLSRIFGFEAIKQALRSAKPDHTRARGSIALGNRHGGPHEHKREKARRARQQGERRTG
jgi:hypothetical protein